MVEEKKVVTYKVEEPLCDEADIGSYLDVLRGIAWFCRPGKTGDGYSDGNRNEIAVDMVVSAWMLGFDPMQVLRSFMDQGMIDQHNDDEDTVRRFERVLDYKDRFEWDWMISPSIYEAFGDAYYYRDRDEIPVRFEV